MAAAVAVLITSITVLVGIDASPALAGPAPVMTAYVPLPADDLVAYFKGVNSGAGTTLDYTVGITNAASGAVMYYDHWEDGFEADIANPAQSSTLVFGDADTGNGNAGTYCSACAGDLLPQGSALIVRNDVATPRSAATTRFDGGDKVASTRGVAITAGGFSTNVGSLLSGVLSAYDTTKYGTSYTVPVGTDTPVPSGTTNAFSYTGASIMAAQADTFVEVDKDADGTFETTATIGQGKSTFVNGSILQGATIRASAPVQVHLLTGQVGSNYQARSFTLFPDEVLSNDYLSPAGSGTNNFRTVNYLYNPGTSDLTVTPTCTGCPASLTVPAQASIAYHSPTNQAVRFQAASSFIAVAGVGAQSGAAPGGGSNQASTWDWGYSMVPTSQLTTQVVLGWAPGNSSNPPSSSPAGYDPVWVTTLSSTTIHVDYDGNPATGAIADPDCFGARHDADISVAALASTKIQDSGDSDMTGARIYTCDGTKIAGAWGQDPAVAPAGSPGFDAGYTIIPTTTMVVEKTSVLANDEDGDGLFGPGDTMTYEIAIADAGSLAFTNVVAKDTLPDGLTYVPGSTEFDDGTTVTPLADDVVPPATTAFPLDDAGASLPNIAAGQTVHLRFDAEITEPWQLGSTIGNTACVTADESAACDTSNTDLATADVSIEKAVTTTPTFVGDEAVFTITASNAGPDVAAGVEVTDVLPAGLEFVSATASQGSYDEATGLWLAGNIDDGDSVTLEIRVRVTTADPVTNFAELTGAGFVDPTSQPTEGPLGPSDPPDQDDEDAASIDVLPRIDLEVDKVVSSPPAADGTTQFTVTVTNSYPMDATGVVVTDRPPSGATYVASTPSAGTFDGTTGTWTVGTVPANSSHTLAVTYDLDQFPAVNRAEVTAANEPDVDSQPAENALDDVTGPDQDDEAEAAAESDYIDLALDKQATPPAFIGQDATFTVTVANDGPADATGVEVTDALPAGLTFVDATASTGSYDELSGVWTVGDVDAGDSETLEITATLEEPGPIANQAEVTAANQDDVDSTPDNGDPDEDDQDSASVSATGASIGDRVWDDQDGNGVQDPGEPGLNGVSVLLYRDVDGNGSFETAVGQVTTAGDGDYGFVHLSSGSYRVIVEEWMAPGVATTPTTFDEVIAPGEVVTTADAGFSLAADLTLAKVLTSTPTYVGDTATFEVIVGNSGPNTATNVEVGDVLPGGLEFVSAQATGGTYDDGTGVWTVGDVPAGATHTLTLTTTVTTDAPVTNVAEVIASDQPDPTSMPNDHLPDDDQGSATVDVDPLVDISVTKVETSSTTYVGEQATYEITVANDGPSNATGVEVTDVLPTGLVFVSATPTAGSYDVGTGVWTVGGLAAGADATLTLVARVDALTTSNTAELTATDQDDVDSTPDNHLIAEDDQDSADLTVLPLVDLSLSKTQTGNPTHLGDTATYLVVLRNDGPSDATGVEVTDLLPAGLSLDSATPSQGSYDDATGIWSVGDLDAGDTATLSIDAVVEQLATTNVAEVTAADQDDADSQLAEDALDEANAPNQDDEGAASLTVEPLVDLSLTKTETASPVHVGDEATFEIEVANDGPSDATSVVVSDVLPVGTTYVSSSADSGSYDPGSGDWAIGTVPTGGTASLTITATMDAESVNNIAEVSSVDQDDADSTPGNHDIGEDDQDDAAVSVDPLVDLSLDKALTATPTHLGDPATYTLTVANAGPSDATGVEVVDQLPTGLTYVSDDSGGDYDQASGLWTVGTVSAGGSRTLTIAVVVDELSTTNTAEIMAGDQDDADSTPGNGDPGEDDQDAQDAQVAPLADLSLSKTSTPATVDQLDDATFTITVNNDGPSAATGVVVTDELPAGVSHTGHEASQGSYDPATGLWDVGTLADGAVATLVIDVHVTGAGPITNVAEVTASNEDDPDSTPDDGDPTQDDRDATVLTAEPVVDLSLTKDVSAPTAHVGSQVTYTLRVANDGPSDATGVEVTELLPSGVTFVDADPGQGSYDEASGTWTVGDVPNGSDAVLEITVTVDDPGDIANVAEVSTADQTDVDSAPAEGPLGGDDGPDEDDEAEASLVGVQIDLELAIAADATNVDVGDQVTYTVTLANQGPSGATGVAVEDLLPVGVTFVDATLDVGSYDPASGTWTVGSFGAGATATLQLVATVDEPGDITNTAQVSAAVEPDVDSTPDNDEPGEDDQAAVTVTGVQVDLSLEKTADDDTPDLGSDVTYTLTVRNAGPSDATGVVVTDDLPDGLAWVSDTSNGAYDPDTGAWAVGDVAAGSEVAIEITANVNAIGTIANHASVTGADQPDVDSTPGNGDPDEDDQDSAEVAVQVASVSGTIWLDEDRDGRRDEGERPIAGVVVQLLDAEGNLVAGTETDADGTYRFTDLAPGEYTIVVDVDTLPDTIDGQSYDPDSVTDGRHRVTLNAGENVVDVDFGYVPPAPGEPNPDPVLPEVPGALARTGLDTWNKVATAIALLVVGSLLVLAGRRRRRPIRRLL